MTTNVLSLVKEALQTRIIQSSDRNWANIQPAYAEGFGVAGAHLSRRSECEGGTPNIQRRSRILNLTFSVPLMTKRTGRFEVEDFVNVSTPATNTDRAILPENYRGALVLSGDRNRAIWSTAA